MFCGLLWLPFAVLSAEPVTVPAEEESDNCFRWDETGKDALAWQTDDFVLLDYSPTDGIWYNNFLQIFVKSVTQFYGGLTSSALADGSYGKGGIVGSSMAVFGGTSCNLRPQHIRVLVCEVVKTMILLLQLFSLSLFHVFVFLSNSLTAYRFCVCATDRSTAHLPVERLQLFLLVNPRRGNPGPWI